MNIVVPLRADATSLKIAAAIEENQKITGAIENSHESPLKIFSATAARSVSALRRIFAVIAGLMVLGVVIKVSTMILAGRQSGHVTGGVSKAEEKVILQEYYQTHGVRPGSRIEADLLEVESRRKENERREAARDKQQEEERYRKFVEDARRTGDQVSENLRRDEERARHEEEQRKQQLEQERRYKEEAEQEAERIRLEIARKKAGLDAPPDSE
jgi:membrane protein involved in colicin uptake